MRRILITPFVESLANEYAADLKKFDAIAKLKKLVTTITPQDARGNYVAYLTALIDNYAKIIVAKPSQFDVLNPDSTGELKLSKKFKSGKKNKKGKLIEETFYEIIVHALGYDWIRNHAYPKYMSQLGIRTCVYCNAQYGVSIEKENNTFTSSYQIDHFLPKSYFPYLATSFFNLQPSCGHCNQMKWKNRARFNLYTEDKSELSPFKFSLDKTSMLHFLLSRDPEDLKILYGVYDKKDDELRQNNEDRFHISLKYEKHKEEASDLVLMSRFYNKAYLTQLESQFSTVAPHFHNRILSIILGFPTEADEVHKRPLTLLRQDIAKQLELL